MKLKSLFVMLTMGLFSLASPATAQDLDSAPGEIHVSMNLAYAKVLVNGDEWDDTEFRANGKTLIISGLDRNESYDISLEASEDGYDKIAFKIDSRKRYKKQRKKRVIRFVAKHKATFRKAKAEVAEQKPAEADEQKPAEAAAPQKATPGKETLKKVDPTDAPAPKRK